MTKVNSTNDALAELLIARAGLGKNRCRSVRYTAEVGKVSTAVFECYVEDSDYQQIETLEFELHRKEEPWPHQPLQTHEPQTRGGLSEKQ